VSSTFFTTGQASNFIEKAFGNGKSSNQGLNISVICPICKRLRDDNFSKQKLVIRTDNFLNHCWSCGFKSKSLVFLLKKYRPSLVQEYIETFLGESHLLRLTIEERIDLGVDEAQETAPELPEGFEMLATSQSASKYFKEHLGYLHNRGIGTEEELWYWKLGLVKWDNKEYRYRIVIPSFDDQGILNYWTARAINKTNFQRYKNPKNKRENIVFNQINLDWTKELLIVEGPFDLIKTKLANENATCLMGSELSSEYLLFEKIVINKTPVVLCMDQDAQKKQLRIAERLYEFGNEVKIIDINKEIEDVGSLSSEKFTQIYESAIHYNQDYALRVKIDSLQK